MFYKKVNKNNNKEMFDFLCDELLETCKDMLEKCTIEEKEIIVTKTEKVLKLNEQAN